jgi:hypothetical protein
VVWVTVVGMFGEPVDLQSRSYGRVYRLRQHQRTILLH